MAKLSTSDEEKETGICFKVHVYTLRHARGAGSGGVLGVFSLLSLVHLSWSTSLSSLTSWAEWYPLCDWEGLGFSDLGILLASSTNSFWNRIEKRPMSICQVKDSPYCFLVFSFCCPFCALASPIPALTLTSARESSLPGFPTRSHRVCCLSLCLNLPLHSIGSSSRIATINISNHLLNLIV